VNRLDQRLREQDENQWIAGDESLMLGLLSHCNLVKRGRKWLCRCPLHDDSRPSGAVWEYHGRWRFGCHPCGVNLDVFGLVMAIERVRFPEARRMLMSRTAVPATPTPVATRTEPWLLACEAPGCGALEGLTPLELACALDVGTFKGGHCRRFGDAVMWRCTRCSRR
jgi:hypothetical protein